MGMEGLAFGFEDIRRKFLKGYAKLDVAYFFKLKDSFKVSIFNPKNELVYEGELTFKYDKEAQSVIPKEIAFKDFQLMISQRYLVLLSTDRELYPPQLILDLEISEKDFLISEVKKLLQTPDENLPNNLKTYKSQFQSIESALMKIGEFAGQPIDFFNYLSQKNSFLFGSTPLEVVLRGDGNHLVEWLNSRAGIN